MKKAKGKRQRVKVWCASLCSARSYIISFLTFSFLLLTSNFCFAIRPFNTEDSFTTPKNFAAIEMGIAMLSLRDNTGSNTFTTTLKYGLADNLDLSFDIPYLSNSAYRSSVGGLSDSHVKMKYKLYEVENELGLSGMLQYQISTGDDSANLSSSQHDITFMLIASRAAPKGFVHFNFGYLFDDEGAGKTMEDAIIYNLGYETLIAEKVILIAETLNSLNTATKDNVSELSAGINYLYDESLSFDCGIGGGVNNASSNTRATVGVTYIFNVAKGLYR
jgi:hypothetical protein